MLAEGAVLYADGGGKVHAFHNPIRGLASACCASSRPAPQIRPGRLQLRPMWIDGLPGYASLERGRVLQTTALAIRDGRIVGIYMTRNPDKLRLAASVAEGLDEGVAH
jgi:hypothetical protein